MNGCVGCNAPITEHFLIAICGHYYCCTCKENRWTLQSKAKCKAEGCDVNLGYNTFGWLKHANLKPVEENTAKMHTVADFPTLEDFDRFLNEKYEMIYKLSVSKEASKATLQVNSFVEQHKDSIARKNAMQQPPDIQYREKYEYLAEEYRRVAKRRLRREQHLDDWCCSPTIDRDKFIEGAMLIEEDEELERQKATYTINGEVRRTTNWAVGNYKPSALTQEKLAAYAAQAPRHPKPVKNETQVEVYKKWNEKYHKMQPEEQKEFLKKVKYAGGFRTDTVRDYTLYLAYDSLFL